MEYQPDWVLSAPAAMYNLSENNSPFNSNISSYFRRPSKIVKTSSRNSSPRHGSKRRATSNIPPARTRSVNDRQRSSVPLSFSQQHRDPRPMSWGPATFTDFQFNSQNVSPQLSFTNQYQPYVDYGTAAVNGLVTPMSYPAADEPQIQELITPLAELSAQEVQPQYDMNPYQQQQFWMPTDMMKEQGFAMDNMFPQTMLQSSWLWTNPASTVPTAPASPSFLPIQGALDASPLDLNTRHIPGSGEGEELVGMGLYDSPAEVQSSTLLFGGFNGTPRRSMKLEESFEPKPEDEGDGVEDKEEDEEDEEQEEMEDEGPAEDDEAPYQEQPLSSQQANLAGQSFFFERDPNPNYTAFPMNSGSTLRSEFQMQYPTYNWV